MGMRGRNLASRGVSLEHSRPQRGHLPERLIVALRADYQLSSLNGT